MKLRKLFVVFELVLSTFGHRGASEAAEEALREFAKDERNTASLTRDQLEERYFQCLDETSRLKVGKKPNHPDFRQEV